MKSWRQTFLIVVVVITILSLLLSACAPVDHSNGQADQIKDQDKNKEKGNDKDQTKTNEIDEDQGGNPDKITICHRTGSAKHPYVEIRVAEDAIKDGHSKHEGDIIPAPKDGCPTTVIITATSTP